MKQSDELSLFVEYMKKRRPDLYANIPDEELKRIALGIRNKKLKSVDKNSVSFRWESEEEKSSYQIKKNENLKKAQMHSHNEEQRKEPIGIGTKAKQLILTKKTPPTPYNREQSGFISVVTLASIITCVCILTAFCAYYFVAR